MFRAEESNGRDKAAWGELYPRTIKPPSPEYKAEIIEGKAFWVRK